MKRVALHVASLLAVIALWLAVRATWSGSAYDETGRSETQPGHKSDGDGSAPDLTDRPPTTHGASIEAALARLRHDPSLSSITLDELRVRLFHGDTLASAQAVADFLNSESDAATDQHFAVGTDGVLSGVPTLRAALLNWLPALDPETALHVARTILKTTHSPDEYAIALRNLAWNDLNGDLHEEMAAGFHGMLSRKDWLARPSTGYLEAFDVAVELCDHPTFSHLAVLVAESQTHPAILHAASISMDRMILRAPELLSAVWDGSGRLLDAAPIQRASLMSRLDISRDDHRTIFLSYLSSPHVNDEERTYFNSLFPNGNHLYGHRLVTTQEESPTIEERADMDARILRQVDQWMTTAPPGAMDSLRRIRDRLGKFAGNSP